MAKRDRETNIQGWFDPENAAENAVIAAFHFLQQKFPAMSPKWVLGNALLYAAQGEGFDVTVSPSTGFDGRIDQLLQSIDRLTFMMENGSYIPTSADAQRAYDEETVQLDAISESVAGRYRALSFEDED